MNRIAFAVLLSMFFSVQSFADQSSAIDVTAKGDTLTVIILEDGCSQLTGRLEVSFDCQENRGVHNFANFCSAEFVYDKIAGQCSSSKLVPRMMELSLKEQNVAKEAIELTIGFRGRTTVVQLDRDSEEVDQKAQPKEGVIIELDPNETILD
jgi:hypothetical protein